jgi:hypothetical protein
MVEHWDYSSLTNIARTILELRLAFCYLCDPKTPRDEWECRWNLFNLHDCVSRIRLFTELHAIQPSSQTEEIEALAEQADELRDRLKSNANFAAMSEKRQRELLKGQKAYLMALEDIAEAAGIGREVYRFFNVLFSSHVHGLPMSFYRLGDGRGQGLPHPVEEHYSALCFSLCSTLMTATRDDVKSLFGDGVE